MSLPSCLRRSGCVAHSGSLKLSGELVERELGETPVLRAARAHGSSKDS